MGDTRRIAEVYINTANGTLCDVSGRKLSGDQEFSLFRKTSSIVRAHLITEFGATNTYMTPSAGTTFFFAADDDYDESADPIVSQNAVFNLAADWSDVDMQNGKICWQIDTTSSALAAEMGTDASWDCKGELWMTAPGAATSSILAQWDITINNITTEINTSSTLTYYSNNIVSQIGQDEVVIYYADGSICQSWSKS